MSPAPRCRPGAPSCAGLRCPLQAGSFRLDHTYRLPGFTLDVPRDWRDYVGELGRKFPADAAGFATLFADIRAIYDGMYSTGRHNGGIPGLPTTVDAMLVFPRQHPLAFHWLDKPFDDLVARHIQNPEARRALSVLAGYVGDRSEALTCGQMMPLFGIITLLPHAQARRWFPGEGTDDWREWRRSRDYQERKTAFGDRLIAAAEKVLPDLSRHIVYRADASPVTYARYDRASAGPIYGMSRYGRLRGAKSPVPGLVVAGSATHGAGVEAAVISGACAADALVPGLLATAAARPGTHMTAPQAAPQRLAKA